MKIIAKYGIEVVGYGVVRRGQEIDLPQELVTDRIVNGFVRSDGKHLVAADPKKAAEKAQESEGNTEASSIGRTVSAMGRDGIMRRLDEMGITYSPKHKTDYLAKLLLEAQGEI